MRRVPKTLVAALVALLLAFGAGACGGGDDSDSTEATTQQAQTDDAPQASNQSKENGSGDSRSGDSAGGEGQSGGSDASDFVPKEHSDSGGGSEQFRVKGGDNSIQEFGEEAAGGEFEAAAVALHNFLDARAEGNWAAACQYMSKSVIESFGKLASQAQQQGADGSCAEILEILINPAAAQSMKEEAAKANVGSLRFEDEQAFVIYTGIGGTVLAMPMANEDGDWKVTSIAGTPLS